LLSCVAAVVQSLVAYYCRLLNVEFVSIVTKHYYY